MRYLIVFSYDGSNFSGYQKQNDGRTVQFELEKVLTKINGAHSVNVFTSGRTDAKVHAINQCAHFNLESNINCNKLAYSLNSLLPDDIYIKKVASISDQFHARFNVISKEYVYKINLGEYSPLDRNYIYQYNHSLNISKMRKAAKYLIGEHNFKSLTKATNEKRNFVRNIKSIKIKKVDNILTISFVGNGFLRYMVRNMVGLLIEIGSDKKKIDDVLYILQSEDRRKAGITAPPQGLYLKSVNYK